MANRLDKIMAPILEKKCKEAYREGYHEGVRVGFQKKDTAYESEIQCLKTILGLDTTGDVVEVVRCKDCTQWMYEYDDVGLCVTDVPDIDGVQRRACDFCSYGERRSE